MAGKLTIVLIVVCFSLLLFDVVHGKDDENDDDRDNDRDDDRDRDNDGPDNERNRGGVQCGPNFCSSYLGDDAYCCYDDPDACCHHPFYNQWWFWIVMMIISMLTSCCCSWLVFRRLCSRCGEDSVGPYQSQLAHYGQPNMYPYGHNPAGYGSFGTGSGKPQSTSFISFAPYAYAQPQTHLFEPQVMDPGAVSSQEPQQSEQGTSQYSTKPSNSQSVPRSESPELRLPDPYDGATAPETSERRSLTRAEEPPAYAP